MVAEPHADNVLLELQFLRDLRNLVPSGPWLRAEVFFEEPLLRRSNGRALALLLGIRKNAMRVTVDILVLRCVLCLDRKH